jgi:transketolase
MPTSTITDERRNELAEMDMRDAFFDEIYRIAREDSSVVFLTDDMDAFSLRRFKNDMPDQFLNIGVAEQNLINLAAGLAMSGKRVFAYGIAPFVTMRCFEQIKVNICSMRLPVTIVGVGAGFSFEFDGPTHHGIHDVPIMRAIPEMNIYNPSDAASAEGIARRVHVVGKPAYVRIDKGTFPVLSDTEDDFDDGYRTINPPGDLTVIATGFMTSRVAGVLESMGSDAGGVGLVDLYRLKPLGPGFESAVIAPAKTVITLEESSVSGGIGTVVAELIAESDAHTKLIRLGAEDRQFIQYGTREWFHTINGIDDESLAETLRQALKQ